MYKKQMFFQRILCYAALIAAALVFLYSLGIMTDMYGAFANTIRRPTSPDKSSVAGTGILYYMQDFNRTFTNVSIVLILVSLTLFITCTHSRRKYYIGNFISTALCLISNVAATVWLVPQIMEYKAQYQQVDFVALKEHAESAGSLYTDSTFWFDVSYVVFGILLLVSVLLVVNLILKIILMKEEKRLIGSRKDVRA